MTWWTMTVENRPETAPSDFATKNPTLTIIKGKNHQND